MTSKAKPADIEKIVSAIAPLNNLYRDRHATIKTKLTAMWNMGDRLVRLGVQSPHAVGVAVQEHTGGVIKRPTIFRSHKLRQIWPEKASLLRDIGQIRSLQYFIEMLPIVDPAQPVRSRLTTSELNGLYKSACSDATAAFKKHIQALKAKYSHGRLGKKLDRGRHLSTLSEVVALFNDIKRRLLGALVSQDDFERVRLAQAFQREDRVVLANACLALTTKENRSLFRPQAPDAVSADEHFRSLYDHFRTLLLDQDDKARARLRRLVYPEELADVAEMLGAIDSVAATEEYRQRASLSIKL